MPVDTKHVDFETMEPLWTRCRAVAAGEDAVKSARETYLPKLSGQVDDPAAYELYLSYAWFFDATGRTVDGLSGMIFRKDPDIDVPESMKEIVDDLTGDGTAFKPFAERVVEDVLVVGRFGMLVDYPPEDPGVRTELEARRSGRRPFVTTYPAEAFTAWETMSKGGREKLTRVCLREEVTEVNEDDEFDPLRTDRYRVLDLDESGLYRQRFFYKADGAEDWVERVEEQRFPKMNGQRMDFIPFVVANPRDQTMTVMKPPILGLVNLNLALYRNTANYEHGLLWTGNPTPWISGHALQEGESLKLGSTTVWVFERAEAKVGFLEFTGKGLEEIRKAMIDKHENLALLGARMLTQEKRGVEATETAQIHRIGEDSLLASISQSVSGALQRVLETVRDWANIQGEVFVELNRDFLPRPMSAQEILAYVKAWQAGGLSDEELFDVWKRGEVVPGDKDFEDHLEELEESAARMPEAVEFLPPALEEGVEPSGIEGVESEG